jgi:hypothetical protein
MSASSAGQSRNSASRHDGGFDRWGIGSRDGWTMLWRGAAQRSLALGDGGTVWAWDGKQRLWNRLEREMESVILREHAQALHRLRRANLVIRLLSSKLPSERAAARAALQRIASAITESWQGAANQGGTSPDGQAKDTDWFDHPAAVYRAVTLDCRYHLAERERAAFDPRVFAALVVTAIEDFKLGRRANPPRLRPEDLALLQSSAARFPMPVAEDLEEPAPDDPDIDAPVSEEAPQAEAAPADAEPEDDGRYNVAPPSGRTPFPEAEYIRGLRDAAADNFAHEDTRHVMLRKRLRMLVMVSGSVAAGLAAIIIVARAF